MRRPIPVLVGGLVFLFSSFSYAALDKWEGKYIAPVQIGNNREQKIVIGPKVWSDERTANVHELIVSDSETKKETWFLLEDLPEVQYAVAGLGALREQGKINCLIMDNKFAIFCQTKPHASDERLRDFTNSSGIFSFPLGGRPIEIKQLQKKNK